MKYGIKVETCNPARYREIVTTLVTGGVDPADIHISCQKTQLDLMQEIRDGLDINAVSCGHCGHLILHSRDREDEPLKCPACGQELNLCDCPDFIFEGDGISNVVI